MQASGRRHTFSATSWLVGGAIAIAVAARLPLLGLPAWADEAGFLTVGGGWQLGGSTGPSGLYGDYWVDRPPVLITLFGLAHAWGGLVPLRLMGAAAAALTIAAVAWVGHTAAGTRAARWAAVVMALMLCSPLHWSFMVDGELLAVPATALGIALVGSGFADVARPGIVRTGLGGALGVVAALTKQNFLDVFVFAAAYAVVQVRSAGTDRTAVARRVVALVAGAACCSLVVAMWTIAHGTSVRAVLYAMYPFRLEAQSPFAWRRLGDLGLAATLSGLALLLVWVAATSARRSRRDANVLALLTVLAFDVVSVLAGTSFWLHYLIQPSVPVAALVGILVARGSRVRLLVLALVPITLLEWVAFVLSSPQTAEEQVGRAIGRVAHPGDSLVTLWGHANVGRAAGLSSPYPYLWVVPARTRDPSAADLEELLSGDSGPTWLVTWRRPRHSAQHGALPRVISSGYRKVAQICGHAVFVRRDVQRPRPLAWPPPRSSDPSRCTSTAVVPSPLRQLTH
jgi:hypothetical protein